MKLLCLGLCFFTCLNLCSAQTTIQNSKDDRSTHWGSVSAQGPNAGFYGQEFHFPKDVELTAVSVYIYNPPGRDESKSSVNFAVWSFDTVPQKQLFLSEAVAIKPEEINNWKTYRFQSPYKLKSGTYMLAVGQPEVQGFVAFGNGLAKEGYHSKFWMKAAFKGYADGNRWIDLAKDDKRSDGEHVVMMRVEYK